MCPSVEFAVCSGVLLQCSLAVFFNSRVPLSRVGLRYLYPPDPYAGGLIVSALFKMVGCPSPSKITFNEINRAKVTLWVGLICPNKVILAVLLFPLRSNLPHCIIRLSDQSFLLPHARGVMTSHDKESPTLARRGRLRAR